MSDDGMRIVRGKGRRPKTSTAPRTLAQVLPGGVALIAVRVGAHLAGPAKGTFDTVLCRPFDLAAREELYLGDLIIASAQRVAVYEFEEEP